MQKTITVSYEGLSCKLEGFDDPLAALPEVLAQLQSQLAEFPVKQDLANPDHPAASQNLMPMNFAEFIAQFDADMPGKQIKAAAAFIHLTTADQSFDLAHIRSVMVQGRNQVNNLEQHFAALVQNRDLLRVSAGQYVLPLEALRSFKRSFPAQRG